MMKITESKLQAVFSILCNVVLKRHVVFDVGSVMIFKHVLIREWRLLEASSKLVFTVVTANSV
jgi:hypothetical protein